MTLFLRVLDTPIDEKAVALREAIEGRGGVFERDPEVFSEIPGSPFAYWVSDELRRVFSRNPRFENSTLDRAARQGGVTGDDFRWYRLWTEVDAASLSVGSRPRCASVVKGGRHSRHYSAVLSVVRWDDARRTFWAFTGLPHRPSLQPASAGFYFRAGMTWPLRGVRFSAQAVPHGCVFTVGGKMAFAREDDLLPLLAIMNSASFDALMVLRAGKVGGVQYEAGLVAETPVPNIPGETASRLAKLARRAWSIKRALDTTNEVSHAFVLPVDLNVLVTGLDRDAIDLELATIQADIDDLSYALYGINAEDRAQIEASLLGPPAPDAIEGDGDASEHDDDVDDAELESGLDRGSTLSWLVGVSFGRFDPRVATGERAVPPEPEPFDPLPSRSPGMYPEGELPADIPDILVDDEGHSADIVERVQTVAQSVKVELPENLRLWLAKDFFALHIRMYSKSRRRAPIYWQLATPSASYSAWIYIHAFSKDTLFRVQNDYVALRLAHEERRLQALHGELRDGATSAQRRTLVAQETLVSELRAFLEEVKRVAPLWNPNLGDGVMINFAPLWRLVPQNKSWQRELKSAWDALCEGKFDWSHLAMHLWPERVLPKCAVDRGLAISHGLEEVFWIEGSDGKWSARNAPTRSVDDLVRERASPAVKSALKSLLEAPAASGGSGNRRGGGRRKSAATVAGGNL